MLQFGAPLPPLPMLPPALTVDQQQQQQQLLAAAANGWPLPPTFDAAPPQPQPQQPPSLHQITYILYLNIIYKFLSNSIFKFTFKNIFYSLLF
jgi:hypothetical protein